MVQGKKPIGNLVSGRIARSRRVVFRFLERAVLTGMFLFVCGWILFRQVIGVMVVSGNAMYPKVNAGDVVIYDRTASTFNQNDVVLFVMDDTVRIGRIAGMAGDLIEKQESGVITINGNVPSGIDSTPYALEGGITYPYTVPEDAYFILCDNTEQSTDSRYYAAVSSDAIEGNVITLLRRRGF